MGIKLLAILASLLLVSPAYAVNEISTAGTKISIGTTSVANALSVQSTLAVGSATYTSKSATTNGAIIQGNVGVGTWIPATLFSLGTSSSGASSTHNAFNIDSNGNITNLGGQVANFNAVTMDLTNGGGLVVIGNASSFASSGLNLHTGSTTGYISFSPNASEKVRIDSSGNLGVGTTIPAATLDVVGQINGYGLHTPNDVGGMTSAGGINFDPTGAGTLMYLTAGRNVGINSVSPGATLDVVGSFRATSYSFAPAFLQSVSINWFDINRVGPLNAGGVNWADINASAKLNNGAVNWVDFNAAGKLGSGGVNWVDVNGVHTIKEGAFNFTDVTTANVTTSAHGLTPKLDGDVNHFLSGTGTFATPSVGAATPQGGPNAVQYNSAGSSAGLEMVLSNNGTNVGIGTVNGKAKLDVEGQSYFNAGNMGIGSLNPGTTLDVNGSVRGTTFSGDGSALANLTTGWTISGSDVSKSSNGNVGIGTNLTTTAALTIMNGNVGIGTWKPAAMLQVGAPATPFRVDSTGSLTMLGGTAVTIQSNQITLNTATGAAFQNSNATAGSSVQILGGASASSGVLIQSTSATGTSDYIRMRVGTNGGTRGMDVTTSGNIGMGTTVAPGKLMILGNVGVGTVAGDAYLTTAPPLGGMAIYGNVAIGTTIPPDKLYVTGSINATTGFKVGTVSGITSGTCTHWTLGLCDAS